MTQKWGQLGGPPDWPGPADAESPPPHPLAPIPPGDTADGDQGERFSLPSDDASGAAPGEPRPGQARAGEDPAAGEGPAAGERQAGAASAGEGSAVGERFAGPEPGRARRRHRRLVRIVLVCAVAALAASGYLWLGAPPPSVQPSPVSTARPVRADLTIQAVLATGGIETVDSYGRPISLGQVLLRADSFRSVQVEPASAGGTWTVQLVLSDAGAGHLAKATAAIACQPAPANLIAIVAGGQVLAQPQVPAQYCRTPMASAKVQVAGDFNYVEARDLARRMAA